MLPCGLAIRAGAAPGIIPFGTMAEAWGAATELGPDRAGNGIFLHINELAIRVFALGS